LSKPIVNLKEKPLHLSADRAKGCGMGALKTYDPIARPCTTAQLTPPQPNKKQKGMGMFSSAHPIPLCPSSFT